MPAPLYSANDFTRALQAKLPRGRVWPRDEDSEQTGTLKGLAPSCARFNARANDLLVDAFPASTLELLPEWEKTLGLPDPCVGPSPTIEQRRAQVVARFIADGGQSVAYFISVAAALGYTIAITQFAPFRFGSRFGQPLCGDVWANVWQVNAPNFTIEFFQFGVSGFGEPFAFWGNSVLQCELQRLSPAHTKLLFSYS
jgi:uncharacterized protein YmfQ (DUF2313 family)